MYKIVLIDLDDTLLDFSKSEEESFIKSFKDRNIDYKSSYLELYREINSKLWIMYEQGKVEKKEIVEKRFELLEDEIGVKLKDFNDLYLLNLSNTANPLKNAYLTIKEISKKVIVIIATNGIQYVQEKRVINSKMNPFIYKVVSSELTEYPKPDIRFFEKCLEGLDYNKKEVLMVGNSLTSDIQGGINFQIDTCFYNPDGYKTKKDITYIINDLKELIDICCK